MGRIEYLQDLHAADAVYHQSCSSNFRTGKNIPKQYVNDSDARLKRTKTQGRPVDTIKGSAFMQVVEYLLENEDEQLTISDLVNKMAEFLEGTEEEAYSNVYMKKKLEEYFGDKIMISSTKKKPNVVTFHHTVALVVHDFYSQSKTEDVEKEKSRIVEAAAKLVKAEIMNMDVSNDNYPSSVVMSSVDTALEFVPGILQTFLRTLITSKDKHLKLASLGQALVQATRPRSIIAPLQLGLGVQMHHHFASKFLVDSLNSHGFCSSYGMIQKYEQSAAVAQGIEVPGWVPGHFMQFVADNVDHNTRTLDGSGTFHGMGIIAAITPGTKSTIPIPRKSVTAQEILKAGQITIRPYHGPKEDTPKLLYKELQAIHMEDSTSSLDLLWKITLPLF